MQVSLKTWTIEKVAALRELVLRNLSAREIGNELGVSRNATISKCSRMGITLKGARRPNPNRKSRKPRRVADGYLPYKSSVSLPEQPAEPPDAPPFLGIALLDLGPRMCRYPEGENPILFCGQPTDGGSWCPYCRGIVFHKVEPAKRNTYVK